MHAHRFFTARGFALLALLVVLAGFFAYQAATSQAHHLKADAYPLYPSAHWGKEKHALFADLSGYQVRSSPFIGISDIAAVVQPFEQYYAQKLLAAGWLVDNTLAASGPGSNSVAYRKGSEYIVISSATDFHGGAPDEPVQCPCDTTLAVFSGF